MQNNLLLQQGLPVPRFVHGCANGSQARFLLAKVNPPRPGVAQDAGTGADSLLTDDVSLKGFMESLIQYAVDS